MNSIEKRKTRQRMQRATDQQFWDEMNIIHSQAYAMCQRHVREALSCMPGITTKQAEAVMKKADEIRENWDGIKTITVEDTGHEELYTCK